MVTTRAHINMKTFSKTEKPTHQQTSKTTDIQQITDTTVLF